MTTRFLRRWIAANAAGELVGLGAGALMALLALTRLEAVLGMVPAAVLSAVVFGVVEGAVVGGAQQRAMLVLPRTPDRRSWVLATAAGGTVAWLAVSLPFALLAAGADATSAGSVEEPAMVVQLAVMAAAGLPAGAVLGIPQALVLRRHTDEPWRWVAANAVAWAVGLPLVQLVAGGLPAVPVVVTVAVVAVGLLAAGAVVGAIHGPTLRRLLADDATTAPARPTPPANVVAMWWVRTAPARLRPHRLTIIEYESSAGHTVSLPVVAVPDGATDGRVVAVGGHEGKRWWRRFRDPTPAVLTDRDGGRPVIGVVTHGHARDEALGAYLADQPRAVPHVTDDTPVVVFHPSPGAAPRPRDRAGRARRPSNA